jgi:F0F1-type ATP synthase assembly protein I
MEDRENDKAEPDFSHDLPEPPNWEYHRPAKAEPPPGARQDPKTKGMGLALAIGYSFVGPVLGGIVIGSLLDGRTGGTFTMVGLLVGTVAAFALLIRLVNKLNDER